MNKRIESGMYTRAAGFGYLSWVKRLANQFGVNGVVSLREDGTVKVVAEGEEEDLAEFAHKLGKGRPFYHVDDFWVKWEESKKEFRDFLIIS